MNIQRLIAASVLMLSATVSLSVHAAGNVGAEMDEFRRTHHYDNTFMKWVPNTPAPVASTVTRAQVQAELAEFQKNSHYDQIADAYVPNQAPAVKTVSRAQVQAELAEFQKNYHYDQVSDAYVPNRK